MRRRWLAFAVILTVPSGCDNVTWGGVDVHMQAPPKKVQSPSGTSETPDSTQAATHAQRPEGPILLVGNRDGTSATLAVVGSVDGDGLDAFNPGDSISDAAAYLTSHGLGPGSRVVLFAEGARVGHLAVERTSVDSAYCVPRPTVTGVVEMVPTAAGAERFAALAGPGVDARPYGRYRAFQDHYDQRVASLNLAAAAIPEVGAAWPPSLLDTRADIQVFQLPGAGGVSVAATFVYHDQLDTSRPQAKAYALFIMGSDQQGTYVSDFVWYRNADQEGKGAPRYFSHLDLNGDGQDEVLLDVLGSRTRWFAVLGRRDGAWVRTFQDPCGSSGAKAGG